MRWERRARTSSLACAARSGRTWAAPRPTSRLRPTFDAIRQAQLVWNVDSGRGVPLTGGPCTYEPCISTGVDLARVWGHRNCYLLGAWGVSAERYGLDLWPGSVRPLHSPAPATPSTT